MEWKIGALIIDSGLPKSMWSLAAAPNEKLHLDGLKRFGCIAYATIPITKTKFSEVAIKAILVGYSHDSYILCHPQINHFVRSKHVRFNEKLVYKDEYEKDQIH